jgi:hypothetical protein
MNLVLQPSKYSQSNVHFLDTKTNMIMDGNFTKTMYTTENMTMNGIYIEFPIQPESVQSFSPSSPLQKYNNETKYIMKFNIEENRSLLETVFKIEDSILKYYMEYFNITKKHILHSLSNQLQHGVVKYSSSHLTSQKNPRKNYFIKISGIWENNYEIGITYKIFEKVETK